MNDNFIESEIITNINNYANILETEYDIKLLYNKERIKNELYIDYRLYNSSFELLIHRYDTLTNTYNFIIGMVRGIKIIREIDNKGGVVNESR